MNRCLNVIGIVLVLLLFSYCGRRDAQRIEGQVSYAHETLAEIDSLMWQQPDSALACLLPCFDTCRDAKFCVSTATAYNRHYANLLLSELLYKNDCAQVNRTELLQAVAYFDSLLSVDGADTRGVSLQARLRRDARRASAQNIAFLDARTHYINGVGYYENDSTVEACAEYLKTLEIMESHFEEKKLVGKKAQFMTYIYSRLGDMFEEQLLAEPAIACYKQALFYCRRKSTSIYGIPVLFYNMGIQYDIINQKDSAAFYYEKALANMPDFDNIHYRDIITSKSVLAYNLGFCLDSVIKDLKYVISLASNDYERTHRFLTLGNILFESKLYDSSRLYLETVFEQQEDIPSKIVAAENLCNIYQIEDDSVKVLQYTSFLADFTMAEIEKKKDVSKINEMFKNYLTQKQEKRAEEERKKSIGKTIGFIVLIAILVALVIFVLVKFRGKKQLRDMEKHHQREMESERQAHKMQQAALAGRLKRSNAALKERGKITHTTTPSHNNAIEKYEDEPICQHILALCNDKKNPIKSTVPIAAYANIALNDAQKAQLKNAAIHHYGSMFEKLKQQYPELKEKDFQYCYLSLLGLDNVQIAVLQQKSISTIWDRENRLKKIFGSEDKISVILHGFLID